MSIRGVTHLTWINNVAWGMSHTACEWGSSNVRHVTHCMWMRLAKCVVATRCLMCINAYIEHESFLCGSCHTLHMNEACQMRRCHTMSHVYECLYRTWIVSMWVMALLILLKCVCIHTNETCPSWELRDAITTSCHGYKSRVMSHVVTPWRLNTLTRTNMSHICVVSNIGIETRHHDCTLHVWMSHVTYTNESCHTS